MIGPERRVDGQWIRSAVQRFERPLISYASHIIGDVERARDIVQDTFIKLCQQNRAEVEPHLAEWLFAVCRNRAIDVRRKERRVREIGTEREAGLQSADEGPAEAIENKDAAAAVVKLIGRLPENQREVIRLKFEHGMSYKQISEITGLSVSNVGFLMHTGLKTVREEMAAGLRRTP